MKTIFLALVGIVMTFASLFFAYYSVRLLYVNLFFEDAAAHRSGGMYIGMVAFPVATIVFGIISWLSFRAIKRG
jgi:hypothetical protein